MGSGTGKLQERGPTGICVVLGGEVGGLLGDKIVYLFTPISPPSKIRFI